MYTAPRSWSQLFLPNCFDGLSPKRAVQQRSPIDWFDGHKSFVLPEPNPKPILILFIIDEIFRQRVTESYAEVVIFCFSLDEMSKLSKSSLIDAP